MILSSLREGAKVNKVKIAKDINDSKNNSIVNSGGVNVVDKRNTDESVNI